MCVFKNHAFIYFLRPPSWSGTHMIHTLCINVAWCCDEPISRAFWHLVTSNLLHCLMPTARSFPRLVGQVPQLAQLPRWPHFPQGPATRATKNSFKICGVSDTADGLVYQICRRHHCFFYQWCPMSPDTNKTTLIKTICCNFLPPLKRSKILYLKKMYNMNFYIRKQWKEAKNFAHLELKIKSALSQTLLIQVLFRTSLQIQRNNLDHWQEPR
jgi:hypothetical protein